MGLAPSDGASFATTHWSLILAAGSPKSSRHSEALEALCQSYWFPIYAFLRRQGHSAHQAEDYTQGFFSYLLEKQGLHRADPKRGRFRSFLLSTLKHFLTDERDRLHAQKRGGGRRVLSLDFETAESQYAIEPAHHLSPEKVFERQWALTLLNRIMGRLKAEFADADKPKLFAILKSALALEGDAVPYRDLAARLDMSESAVKVAVHRLRKRYRMLLREEISQTVATEDQVDQEVRDLFAAFSP